MEEGFGPTHVVYRIVLAVAPAEASVAVLHAHTKGIGSPDAVAQVHVAGMRLFGALTDAHGSLERIGAIGLFKGVEIGFERAPAQQAGMEVHHFAVIDRVAEETSRHHVGIDAQTAEGANGVARQGERHALHYGLGGFCLLRLGERLVRIER